MNLLSIIVIFYITPTVLSTVVSYLYTKQQEGTNRAFISGMYYRLIPILNIELTVVITRLVVEHYLIHNQGMQDFLNRKL